MSAIAATMRRPSDGRLLLGVCAAVARRYDIDPVLVRIVFAIGLFTLTTPFLVAYAGLALVVPRDDGRMLIGGEPGDNRESLIGWAVVIAASAFVIATPSILVGDNLGAFEAGMLLIAVALIAYAVTKGSDDAPPATQATRAVAPEAPTEVREESRGEAPTKPLIQPPTPPNPLPPKSEKGASLFGPVAAVIVGLLGFGAVIVSVFDIGVTPVGVAVAFGSLAVLCGGVAIASADRRGLVPLLIFGGLFAAIAAGAAIGRDEFDRGIGYREYDPVTVSEVEEGYEVGMGFMEIDLRDVELPPGETVMPMHVGFGAAEITVPVDLEVVTSGDDVGGDVAAADAPAESAPEAPQRDGEQQPPEPPVLVIDGDINAGVIDLLRPGVSD
jgi:phage shock protein PspC (stress-responsive transcriptional regulator)